MAARGQLTAQDGNSGRSLQCCRGYARRQKDHRSMKHAPPVSNVLADGWLAGRRCWPLRCSAFWRRPRDRPPRMPASAAFRGAGECARIKRLGQRSKRHRERGQGAGDPAAGDKPGDAVHGVPVNSLPDLAGAARGEDQTHAICVKSRRGGKETVRERDESATTRQPSGSETNCSTAKF